MSLIKDLKKYNFSLFSSDILAGLTVAVILVPQAMAYAMLAGMPPVYGLYAALIPLIVYPIFSSSRLLSVGPVALMSIIVLTGVSLFAQPGTDLYIDLVLLSALFAGILQVIYAILRLGVLSNFLSRPVMNGFISAAGIIIAVSQIKYLLTLDTPRSSSIIQMITDDVNLISTSNLYSLGLGILGIVLILILKKIHHSIPRYLITAIVGTVVLYGASLHQESVPIVGDISRGLPRFYTGFLKYDYFVTILPSALVISLICFIGSFSIAKTMSGDKNVANISADKELLGLGLAKLIGSFFMAMPSTGSFTRSAVNAEAGAKTGMASVFSAIFIGLILAFLSSLFYFLPEPILAAIVITSVFNLIDIQEAKRLFYVDRSDFWVFILTFILTLVLGIVNGIITGIILSLVSIIVRSAKPHFAELGRLPGTNTYRNIERYADAQVDDKVLILRYDQDLFFGNAEHFYKSVTAKAKEKGGIEKLVLHVGAIHKMDTTALRKVEDLVDCFKRNNKQLIFTNISGPIRDLFSKAGLNEKIGEENMHINIAHALLGDTHQEKKDLSIKYSGQNKDQKKQ